MARITFLLESTAEDHTGEQSPQWSCTSRLWSRGWQTTIRPNPAHHLFLYIKVYWNTACSIFYIVHSYSHDTTIESSSCDRDYMVHKAYNVYYLAFDGKVAEPLLQKEDRDLTVFYFMIVQDSYSDQRKLLFTESLTISRKIFL